jgi:uncharacterized protein (DUF2147 family)
LKPYGWNKSRLGIRARKARAETWLKGEKLVTLFGSSKGRAASLAPVGVLLVLLASSGAYAGAATNGVWARDDGQVRVRLTRCGGKICAVNTWARDPQGQEKAGDRFIMTMTSTGASHWTGSAFDPKRNLVYSMDMSMAGGQMTTRGCLTGSSLCQSAAWTRIGN